MKRITKDKLKELYMSNTNAGLARKLEISTTTLSKYLIDSGIELKGKGNRESKRKRKLEII